MNASCTHVQVELCKDRIGLLGTQAPVGPASWHIPKVSIIGIPERPGYPTAAALAKTLACAPGRPVTVADIEGDAATLQRTGLFRTVKPSARPLEGQNAPMLWVNPDADAEGGFRIDTLPSLGQVEFRCVPAVLSAPLRAPLLGSAHAEREFVRCAHAAGEP